MDLPDSITVLKLWDSVDASFSRSMVFIVTLMTYSITPSLVRSTIPIDWSISYLGSNKHAKASSLFASVLLNLKPFKH